VLPFGRAKKVTEGDDQPRHLGRDGAALRGRAPRRGSRPTSSTCGR
jgi:hypothetical protein